MMHRNLLPSFSRAHVNVAGLVLIAGMLVSGCEQARDVFGMNKQAPDEFAVVTRAPLALPPNYSLRPPKPGAPRPQEVAIPEQARDILVGSGGASEARGAGSAGEQALLSSAGATNADSSIRQQIDKETVALAKAEDSFVNRLIFWQEKPPPGKVVDPEGETRRIQENAALGAPTTRGKSPVIERKEKGWLEGIF